MVCLGVILSTVGRYVIEEVHNLVGLFIILISTASLLVAGYLGVKYFITELNANPYNPFSVLDVDTDSKV